MRILYRYIFRRGLAASGYVVTTCCVIASLINLFDILDDVVKQNVAAEFVYRYMLINLAPRVMELLSIMMILIGLYSMGELNRRLELVSMRAAGLSDGQLMRPIVYLSVLVFAVAGAAQALYLPGLLKQAEELESMLKSGRDIGALEKPFYVQKDRTAMQALSFQPGKNLVRGVRLYVLDHERVSEYYETDTLVKGARGWIMSRGVFRKMDPMTMQVLKYTPFDEWPWPADFPSPELMIAAASNRQRHVQWMTIPELIVERSFLARQEIHRRIAMVIAIALGPVIGAWYGMKMQRFNAARAISLAMVIGFSHRLLLDGFLAVGMELGMSWTCHAANVFLALSVLAAPFLTASVRA